MSVFENIAYPLKNQKQSKSEIQTEVNSLSKKLQINHLLHRKPDDLSGGEAQRVALARILALKPKVLLLDEPLSAVDIQLKTSLKRLLKKLNREGLTIIHVTHDYEEALALARHIVVMDNGRIVQQGGPAEVFKNPESPFVANFMGAKNFFKAIKLDEGEIIINNKIKLFSNINSGKKNGYAMVSQEEISLFKTKPEFSSARNLLSGVITDIIPNQYGFEVLLDCGLEFSVYITRKSLKSMDINEGENLWLSFKAASVKFIEN
jgi:molybdopterin-binding protein